MVIMDINLTALGQGESAYVRQVNAPPSMLQRLTDLGLVPGTQVRCELLSPAGDPAAYRIRGSLIALRRADAAGVAVIPEEECS